MKQFLTKSYNVKIYYFYQYFTILITNETNPCKILHCRVENTKVAKKQMLPKRKSFQSANVKKKRKCWQNANDAKIQNFAKTYVFTNLA